MPEGSFGKRTEEERNVMIKRKWDIRIGNTRSSGRGFSQHMLSDLAVALRRHFFRREVSRVFALVSSEIIRFLSSMGTHMPQEFCARCFPTGEVN